jgi:hypothetical protein
MTSQPWSDAVPEPLRGAKMVCPLASLLVCREIWFRAGAAIAAPREQSRPRSPK